MTKLLSKKKYIFIITIIFVFLIFKNALMHYLYFDLNASDLSYDTLVKLKAQYLKTKLSLRMIQFNFMFYVSFFIPILICILGYDYNKIKSNFIKFNIGKNSNYNKELLKLKLKSAGLVSLILIISYTLYVLLSYFLGGDQTTFLEGAFTSSYILNYIFGTNFGFIVFLILFVAIAGFLNALFLFNLIDYQSYVMAVIEFLGTLWVSSMVLYMYIPRSFVPMESIMAAFAGDRTLIKLLSSYITIFVIYKVLVFRRKFEIK